MKKLVVAGMMIMLCLLAEAQVEITQNPASDVSSVFEVDAISFASATSSKSRLDVYAAIPYEQLSFVKQDDKFVASYEMTINIFDSAKTLVLEKVWTDEVKAPSFNQSISSGSFSLVQRSVELSPGFYQIVVQSRDLESRVVRRVARQLTISDYSGPGFTMSDIMLISKLTTVGDKKTITPTISANVGTIPPPLHLFFEVYNEPKMDSVTFSIVVLSDKNAEVSKKDTTLLLRPGRNQVFLEYDHSVLPIGDYKMYVQALPSKVLPDAKVLATTSRLFSVHWAGMPKNVKDLDVAIEQLRYIAKDKELDKLKDAATQEEKQKLFLEFWKKRDPNPNTIRNEKMDEFYGRVDYANKHFKHYTEGWRTDMGMVYILFGTPNNVDRHPFDSDSKPYEIWSYYDLNYNFVF
ncbi:MAG: GWxTD domain-containing protein, partial [bacterium]